MKITVAFSIVVVIAMILIGTGMQMGGYWFCNNYLDVSFYQWIDLLVRIIFWLGIALLFLRNSELHLSTERGTAFIGFKIGLFTFLLSICFTILKHPFYYSNNVFSNAQWLPHSFISALNNIHTMKTAPIAISTIILAPIMEELFFRGYILGGLLRRYSHGVAICLSSLLFSLFHIGNFSSMLASLAFGFLAAFWYIKTKRVGLCILLHLFTNLFWFLGVVFTEQFDNIFALLGNGIVYWSIIFCAMLGLSGILLVQKNLKTSNSSNR